jgi:protein-tyrosine phosphatase
MDYFVPKKMRIAPVLEYKGSVLYVGRYPNAISITLLNTYNIRTNINLSGYKAGNPYEVAIEDFHDQSRDPKIAKEMIIMVAMMIHNALERGNVLVNCMCGYNRAPTVIAAYLIMYHNFAPETAIRHVRSVNKRYRNMEAIGNPMFEKILYTIK